MLFAVDPAGTGVCLRARPGPQRERWLARLADLMPERPLRKIPHGIADDRLLGGLDLAATLATGKPIAERGALADADGGAIIVPSAERMPAAIAARIAAVHDSGEIRMERDGLRQRFAARFGLILVDEGLDEERPPASLLDRVAFHADMTDVTLAVLDGSPTALDGLEAARRRLPEVAVDDDAISALCTAAAALGIRSARAPLLALRAAKAAAALDARDFVSGEDVVLAAQLVLAWRAQTLPAEEAEPDATDDPPDEQQGERDTDEASPHAGDEMLEDIVLAAVHAALPPDLLAQLLTDRAQGKRPGDAGRVGALQKSAKRGRRIGVRRGDPRGGARLDLVATLRAAAPWQRMRQAEHASPLTTVDEEPPLGPHPPPASALTLDGRGRREAPGEGGAARSEPNGPAHGHRPRTDATRLKLRIRPSDFRTARFAQRRETLTIFAVDASGSLALNRLAEAKGAVELLLADCYVRRDQVALIAFRGRGAEVLLPPTRSLVRAKRCLSSLPGGGGTPLANGIDAAAALASAALRRAQTPLIVMLTDGRANIGRTGQPGRPAAQADAIASANALRAIGLRSLLIDTAPQPDPRAADLATAMGAIYLALPQMDAGLISSAVKGAWLRPRAARHG